MSSIDFRRPHNLGMQQAHEAVNAIAGELTRALDITSEWRGDTLHFQRSGATGTIQVTGDSVHFHIDLSLLLRPAKSKIETKVQQYFDHFFQHTA